MPTLNHKPFVITALCSLFLVFTTFVASVHATSFNWSYEFGDMTVVSGMLEGDIDATDSNLVTVTSIMGEWTGDPLWQINELLLPFNTISFDGTEFDLFTFGPESATFELLIGPVNNHAVLRERFSAGTVTDAPIDTARWSLTPKITQKTLDAPATTTLMLIGGTGMLGLLAWARRRDKRLAAT